MQFCRPAWEQRQGNYSRRFTVLTAGIQSRTLTTHPMPHIQVGASPGLAVSAGGGHGMKYSVIFTTDPCALNVKYAAIPTGEAAVSQWMPPFMSKMVGSSWR